MQDESKNTPKLGRFRRGHNAGTPETAKRNLLETTLPSVRGNTSRTTLMQDDIMRKQKLPKITSKKIAANRQSIMPSQLLLDVSKKADTESKELEFGLLYDEYLQVKLMDLIMKKKTEEKKQLMVMQLATVAQELDQDTQKLIKIKKRERDVINLHLEQEEIDVQMDAVAKCTKNETFKSAKAMVSKLRSLLEPLDVLRCNGIILPETQEEWKETQEILTRCSSALKNIMNLIGSKGEAYCTMSAGLKDFDETHSEIENLQKKLEEALCNLQVLVLKNTSLSLTYNGSQ
ncbi:hypothetical protein DMN91_010132 [Ooceraea biroi]|uniref:Uncharacterized protein n=1 Tax=Ooceraea biroi TaxID=2015173 RepID=A0A026W7X8_OOCBI|nr:uncharacterized protein LOC105282155 [Ooceraea biroi]EZA52160.1 hypothetical protein X777_08672 [Ooceraea biroi]RLU17893.1 hypothetical protein DMN91_010132 [Ooceraea biroi]